LSDQELDRLFAAYRDAVPDPEPSPAFLPKLWEAIEARRTFRLRFQRASRLLITASGAIWLAMAMVLIIESTVSNSRPGPAIDLLADSHPADSIDLALSPHASGPDRK